MSEKFLDRVVNSLFLSADHVQLGSGDDRENYLKNFISCLNNAGEMVDLITKKFVSTTISRDDILEYVNTSAYFARLKCEFEQRIVNKKLSQSIIGLHGLLVDVTKNPIKTPKVNYVELFRNGVCSELKALGLSEESIERGLEENANVWRPRATEIEFVKEFYKYGICSNVASGCLDLYANELKTEYINYSDFMYYVRHKTAIDTYGTKTHAMNMTMDEAAQCLYKIRQMADRMLYGESSALNANNDGTESYINCPD